MFKIEKIQKKDNNTGVISFYLYDFEHQIFFDYVIKKVKKDYDYLDYNYSSSTDEEVGGFVYKNSITCPINDDIDIIFFKLIESYNKIIKFEKYNTIIKENFWTKRYTHEEKSINQKKEEVSRIKNDIDFILSRERHYLEFLDVDWNLVKREYKINEILK